MTLQNVYQYLCQGEFAEAERRCQVLLRAQPANLDAWNMLAIVLRSRGELNSAIDAMETVIRLAPQSADAHNNFANLLKDVGRVEEAIERYRRAIALAPGHANAHANLAVLLAETGSCDEAEVLARKSISLSPKALDAWASLTKVHESRCAYGKAVETLKAAQRYHTDNALLWTMLGTTQMAAKRPHEAVESLRKATMLDPRSTAAFNNLGSALREIGELEEAEAAIRQAIQLNPDQAEFYANLANALVSMQRLPDAEACLGRALSLRPGYPEARFVRGLIRLLRGELAEGWPEYAYRWQIPFYLKLKRDFSAPEWGGGEFRNKRLLVFSEQGLGDTLQFVRYLPLVKALGGEVIFECQPQVKRLLKNTPGADLLLSNDESLPEFDLQIPLLSIAGVLGTTLANVPLSAGYLSPPDAECEYWRNRIRSLGPGFRVGVAWAGNPNHQNDRNRSMSPEELAPLAKIAGIRWFSLQKGVAGSNKTPASTGLPLTDWTEELNDYADTAGLVANLDLVIAVDTSVVHLAGAMGRPVWAMLPFSPDWRWLLERKDSIWYDSLRLFRQTQRGDWSDVIGTIATELEMLRGNQAGVSGDEGLQ